MKNAHSLPIEVENKVEEKISSMRKKIKEAFDVEVIDFEIRYDLFGLTTLGFSSFGLQLMRLHVGLLQECEDIYINDVVVHEFAHLVTPCLYPTGVSRDGRKVTAHGEEFRRICRVLGVEGKATTDQYANSKTLKTIVANRKLEKEKEAQIHAKEDLLASFEVTIAWRYHIYVGIKEPQKTLLLYQLRQAISTIQDTDSCLYYANEPFDEVDMYSLIDKVQYDDMIDIRYGEVLLKELTEIGKMLYSFGDVHDAYCTLETIQRMEKSQEE